MLETHNRIFVYIFLSLVKLGAVAPSCQERAWKPMAPATRWGFWRSKLYSMQRCSLLTNVSSLRLAWINNKRMLSNDGGAVRPLQKQVFLNWLAQTPIRSKEKRLSTRSRLASETTTVYSYRLATCSLRALSVWTFYWALFCQCKDAPWNTMSGRATSFFIRVHVNDVTYLGSSSFGEDLPEGVLLIHLLSTDRLCQNLFCKQVWRHVSKFLKHVVSDCVLAITSLVTFSLSKKPTSIQWWSSYLFFFPTGCTFSLSY